ncbi:MAG: hypothetical protein V4683_01375 [Bacteroidota bacterium]
MRKFLIVFLLFNKFNSFSQRDRHPVMDNNRYQFGLSESTIEVLESKDTIFVTKTKVKGNNTNTIEEVEKRYKGTPIYSNAWFPNCSIYLNGHLTKGSIAYNLLNREVQFSAGDINKALAIKPDSFSIASQKFVQLNKTVKNAHNIFYQLIFKNEKLSLYKALNCAYRPKVYGQQTGYEINTDGFEGHFLKWTTLHILENGELNELKANSSIYKNLGEKKSEVEKYAKSNNLSPKKENDLIEIIKYYASL